MPERGLKISLHTRGSQVTELHQQLQALGYQVPANELEKSLFGTGTRDAIRDFQNKNRLLRTSGVDEATRNALDNAVKERETGSPRLEGRAIFENGAPAISINLRLYQVRFGKSRRLLVETQTDAQGFFEFEYQSRSRGFTGIEILAVAESGDEIALAPPKFGNRKNEILNVVVPDSARALESEFQRLTAAVAQHVGSIEDLADAEETDQRSDLSVLHQASGWDARLIALRAQAQKHTGETKIDPEVLYGLFRAGLPFEPALLASVHEQDIQAALEKSVAAGVIQLDERGMAEAHKAIKTFSRQHRKLQRATGALHDLPTMLARSDLTDNQRRTFEGLVIDYADNPEELWERAKQARIGERKINNLRIQGKLLYLTMNNADLADLLKTDIKTESDMAQLVDQDLDQPETWEERIREHVATQNLTLADMVPPAFEGEDEDTRLRSYADDLARKVRITFPTRVVSRMLQRGELRLGEGFDLAKIQNTLNKAEPLGFQLGGTSVERFLRDHQTELFAANASAETIAASKAGIKKLSRLYQITPTNQALTILADAGIDSAQDVVAFGEAFFIKSFGSAFDDHPAFSEKIAKLIFRKAQQVTTVAYSFFGAIKQAESTPPIFAIAPEPETQSRLTDNLKEQYPSMEQLFGSLDFCECEHCQSVLSPAAYLVDVLKFLDPDEVHWQYKLTDWRNTHNDEAYPHPKPYDVLVARRPDIPHLPLSCENTHTALPYIDLVNEILEYHVAHGRLDSQAVYDTGNASTEELLAEPHNILPAAYQTLSETKYPLNMPFNLWLQTSRKFFQHFDTPLWQAMEVLNPAPQLFNRMEVSYDEIFLESLGLSPQETAIFTNAEPSADWFELFGYSSAAEALDVALDEAGQRVDLNSAKSLSRRLDVSYQELVSLVKSRFVNPQLGLLFTLKKFGISVEAVFRYKGHADYPVFSASGLANFEAKLDAVDERFADDADFKVGTVLDEAWQQGHFNRILVLADTESGCNFDKTLLRHADATPVNWFALHRLNLFVRLRRKLGCSIDELDRALSVFVSEPEPGASPEQNFGERLHTALFYLAHLYALDERLSLGKRGRTELLAVWVDLDHPANTALYQELFLTPSILKNHPVFDSALGEYLKAGNIPFKEHLTAVQGALNLTVDEVGRVLRNLGESIDTASLTMPVVSQLYRTKLLAKGLKLSVAELIDLKEMSGIGPFTALADGPISSLEEDHPFTETLAFVDVAQRVKQSPFSVEDLRYLLIHDFDELGNFAASEKEPLTLVLALVAEVIRIREQYAIPEDPLNFNDELMAQALGFLLPSEVVERFMGILLETGSTTVELKVAQDDQLSSDMILPPNVELDYDKVREIQKLTVRGVLLEEGKAALLAVSANALWVQLVEDAASQTEALFDDYLRKVEFGPTTRGFFSQSQIATLITSAESIPEDASQEQQESALQANEAQLRNKRSIVAEAFLPVLQAKLIENSMQELLADELAVELPVVSMLCTQILHSREQVDRPLLSDFIDVASPGLSITFFESNDGTGSAQETRLMSSSDIEASNIPDSAQSLRVAGYLRVPQDGPFRFFVSGLNSGARIELRLRDLPQSDLLRGTASDAISEFSEFAELKTSAVYHYELLVNNLSGGGVRLEVQSTNLPRGALNRLSIFAEHRVNAFHAARIALGKAVQLVSALELSEQEVRYLHDQSEDFGGFDLNRLPISRIAPEPDLFQAMMRIIAYHELRNEVSGGGDGLITLFEHARIVRPITDPGNEAKDQLLEDVSHRVAQLTRRSQSTVQAAIEQLKFGITTSLESDNQSFEMTDLINEQGVRKLWAVLQIGNRFGIPTDKIAAWAIGNPDHEIARDLRNTVKARYNTESWQRIARPIFDELRQQQRDALVAYAIRDLGLNRIEELFEHFLIDPGMEPVVQTSRLRLAISSIQLFVQRSLLNLEKQVNPTMINSKHWQWMKRYRVWEANRKIFLYPENWLEPEFRDDKSHLCTELESALLQGDVSSDLVESAFHTYLKGLEKVAQLDIVTMYSEEKAEPESNRLHVVGRTQNNPYQYYYRTSAHRTWSPWIPISTQIESSHIAGVVWRGRFYLFWITFLKIPESKELQVSGSDDGDTIAGTTIKKFAELTSSGKAQKSVQLKLNWCEYYQGQWTTPESSEFAKARKVPVPDDFKESECFIYIDKEYDAGQEKALLVKFHLKHTDLRPPSIHLPGSTKGVTVVFKIVSRLSPPNPFIDFDSTLRRVPFVTAGYTFSQFNVEGSLEVGYFEHLFLKEGGFKIGKKAYRTILENNKDKFTVLATSNQPRLPTAEIGSLVSPLFYKSVHPNPLTFFVEPTLTETKIVEWEQWGIQATSYPINFATQRAVVIAASNPVVPTVINHDVNDSAFFGIQSNEDWLIQPSVAVQYGDVVIGQQGRVTTQALGDSINHSLQVVGDVDAIRKIAGFSGRSS